MRAGRKPLPTSVKRLRGNPGKRPLNPREPEPAPMLPACPAHLSDEAKREWKVVGKMLVSVGLMTEIDRTALAAYCQAWGRWVEAEEQLRKFGTVIKSRSGFPVQSPYLAIANKALEQMMRLLPEFGMTPSSRSRIATSLPAPQGNDDAEFFDEAA